jgi:hypothetical protein
VLVGFWTYGRSTGKNVIPPLRERHATRDTDGLTIEGAHRPEFFRDRRAVIRYARVGESADGKTEPMVRDLLAERPAP